LQGVPLIKTNRFLFKEEHGIGKFVDVLGPEVSKSWLCARSSTTCFQIIFI